MDSNSTGSSHSDNLNIQLKYMEKTNYALISALYASGNKGLYSDIYFPIIKYAIVEIFSKHKENHPYCKAEDIHDYILEKFGIAIPHIVICKSVVKIDAQKWGNIHLTVFENGNSFQIQGATFDLDEVNVDDREKVFTAQLTVIEDKYKEFIKQEGSIDDGVSFVQFISDNTDDILGYFEEQDTSNVDEKYATIVFFLQYLNDYEKDLYQVANQLFWGSIIAGFLRSDKPDVEEDENGIKTEFFLDTSIVMGLLGLSTPQREIHSKEVCDIIRSAGGLLRVNPMTVDEISFILQSVEQNGPNPLTDIASAYERRCLDAPKLAGIRLSLQQIIEKQGIVVFPMMNPSDKFKIVQSYKGKNVTKLLSEARTKKPTSYNSENYREIHDVYMDDFISDRRKKKNDNYHVFFLTSNRDLISFCNTMHPATHNMKSTGRVVLELWMHNTKPVDISGCMLTETMARCLDLHSTRVRNKIAEVSRFYNKTKNDFNADVYKDFIKQLYRRAKNVILATEVDPDNVIEGEFGRIIKEAVAADNLNYNKEVAKVREKNEQLNASIASKSEEIETKNQEVISLKNSNDELTKHNEKLSSDLESRENELAKINEERKDEKAAKEMAERKLLLYKKRDALRDTIAHIEADLAPYKKAIEKSFCNWQPRLFYILGFLCLLCVLILWGCFFIIKDKMPEQLCDNIGTLSSILIPVCVLFVGIGHKYNEPESINRRRDANQKRWIEKEENKKYTILITDLSKTQSQLKEVEDELKTNE